MKNFLKSKFGTILVLIATVALAGIAIFTAFRLYKLRQEAVTPNAPTSKPAAATCTEQCPGSDGVLRNCHPPDSDGTSNDSICKASAVGRIESCGNVDYCCNGTTWTTIMTACQLDSLTPTPDSTCETLSFTITTTATPTASSTATPTATPTASSTTTSSPTATPTSTATATSSSEATLPEAGTSLPSILGLGIGGILLIVSLLLAL